MCNTINTSVLTTTKAEHKHHKYTKRANIPQYYLTRRLPFNFHPCPYVLQPWPPTGNEPLPRERVYQTGKADILPSAKRVYLMKPCFTLSPHAGLNSETIEYPASFSPFLMNAICSAFRVSITTRKKQAVTLLVLLFRS